ncbi:hypothetical protein THRCLA_06232 [Thraustotheca clavata]|uniref:AAA+ ATPase domain-containing protein n=1 Tax=Thraustotheca clavata TaxID=74557 RepID=A0A1V9ZQ09_9STRA|nr:hypothetical protein THRCLA_06232 [Thraustotheca clavata]
MGKWSHVCMAAVAASVGFYMTPPEHQNSLLKVLEAFTAPSIPFEIDPAFNVSNCLELTKPHLTTVHGVPGFHVVCLVGTANNTVQGLVFEEGFVSHPQYFEVDRNFATLQDHLEKAMGIEAPIDEKAKKYRQRPQFYSVDGNHLIHMDQLLHNSVVYLFEGGQFIWPGIEVGHQRELHDIPGLGNIKIETLSMEPLVFSVERFLKDHEIDTILELSLPHLVASTVKLQDGDGDKPASEWRTSSQYFLPSDKSPILLDIDNRVAELVKVDITHQEAVQVLRYEKTQKYDHHTDYFDANFYQTAPDFLESIEYGHKNRMITVFWYMSDVQAGGHTIFPRAGGQPIPSTFTDCSIGLKVKPQKGKVIVFYSMLPNGDLDPMSLHELSLGYMVVISVVFLAILSTTSNGLILNRNIRATANATSVPYTEAFSRVEPANLTHSFNVITRIPLNSFEFKYDSIPGRRQLGLIGSPVTRELLPEGIHVYPERQVFSQEKEKIAIQNFHAIDKDALFMHNIGATQVLIHRHEQTKSELNHLVRQVNTADEVLKTLQVHLDQEASAVLIEERKIAEANVRSAVIALESVKVKAEEERKNLELSKQNAFEVAEKENTLHTERIRFEDTQRRDQNRELVELQESANARMELQRRETEAILKQKQLDADKERMWLERNTTLEKAVIDVEGRIKQQRMNQDIEMAQLQAQFQAEKDKVMTALQAIFDNLGSGFMVLMADTDKLMKFIGSFVALAFGIYFTREAIRISGQLVEQRLGKPSLVRETSRRGGLYGWLRSWFDKPLGVEPLSDVVVHAALETRLYNLAKSTKNAKKHGAPYRHLLLYGPPGTGKTMVAKRLAICSGMDYAIMSGGDVGPLGSDAVTELHALFRWAQASPRGVLIFIDEAEAFLGCRATRKTHMSEAMRNALNALLFHTGSQTKQFMLVIATNRPEDLDSAITDRIDDALHFELPETNERIRLLELYFTEFVGNLPGGDSKECKAVLNKFGARTAGMSGREINKTMLYLQNMVYAQDEVIVTPTLVDRVISEKIDEHMRKTELKSYKE